MSTETAKCCGGETRTTTSWGSRYGTTCLTISRKCRRRHKLTLVSAAACIPHPATETETRARCRAWSLPFTCWRFVVPSAPTIKEIIDAEEVRVIVVEDEQEAEVEHRPHEGEHADNDGEPLQHPAIMSGQLPCVPQQPPLTPRPRPGSETRARSGAAEESKPEDESACVA